MSKKSKILSAYRVLDLSGEKGWFCGKLLADMGADVIRIDKPGKKLPVDFLNAGKRCITLNPETQKGQDLFKRLIQTTDILIENYQPDYLDKIGLGYADLNQINPRLIMASITDLGQTGPYRDYRSSDLVAGALGGQMYVCGDIDTPPLKLFGKQAYYSACLFAANGIMLALWDRHTSGKGQYVDISIHECVAATLDHVLVRYFYNGEVAERQGSLYWNNAFRIFPCRDGHILLSLFYQWETLVEWLASEDMAQDLADKKWLNPEERLRSIQHIIEVLEKWTKCCNVAELVEQGQAMRFPWANVATIPQMVQNPQLNERGFFVDGEGGKKYPGAPCKLSRSPWMTQTKTSNPGEHNKQIYYELGLSEKELEGLTRERVI